ncbi:GDSL-type esterase/lipase family protein [Flavobacteriaceae bacterium MEBiC06508]
MRVAITIYYGQVVSSSDITSHVASRTDSYILASDHASSASFSGATVTAHWFHINTIDVIAANTAGCVGVLGNSITDGFGLHGGLQNRWTDIFSEQLLNDDRTKNVGVLNLGIGGSLIRTSGISRYKEDLLAQSGLRWIIIFYGTNDIYSNASATSIINAYKTIINNAHARNIKAYGATITPFKGSGHYSAAHEIVRNDVNTWIRTPGNFDACIDFDKAIRDPNDIEKLLKKYSNDWLHPNVDGYAFLGKSVDLDLFTEIDENTLVEADAGSDQVAVDYDNDGIESIKLDGSASYAFGDNIVSYKWSKNGTQFATGKTATVSLALGIHIITLTVADKNGTIDSDEVTIEVTKDRRK